MATYDIAALAEPLSEDEPCGPDLDELGDPEYWQFTGAIETELPTSFDTFFEARHAAHDYSEKLKACYELLERTRDLRLVLWLAKLTVLSRDLDAFVDSITVLNRLVTEQWDNVHPRPFEDGDQTMRIVTLERLDERPSVELPLQYVRLIEDHSGPVAFRDYLVAEGEVQPRDGERFRSGDDLRKTLQRCDVEKIVEARDKIDAMRQSVSSLKSTWMDKTGYDQPLTVQRFPELLDRIHTYLNTAVAERRPDLAGEEGTEAETDGDGEDTGAADAGPAAPRGAINDMRDVVRALRAVNAYFEEFEPSSPARLLVKQSEALVGRSWIDVVQTLLPNNFDYAAITVQGSSSFRLPLPALSDRLQIGQGYDAPPSFDDLEDDEGYEDDESEDGSAAPRATFEVRQRNDAGALLSDVVSYYRRVEPSSPLPALLDRAQALLTRDFNSIVAEILSEET